MSAVPAVDGTTAAAPAASKTDESKTDESKTKTKSKTVSIVSELYPRSIEGHEIPGAQALQLKKIETRSCY